MPRGATRAADLDTLRDCPVADYLLRTTHHDAAPGDPALFHQAPADDLLTITRRDRRYEETPLLGTRLPTPASKLA